MKFQETALVALSVVAVAAAIDCNPDTLGVEIPTITYADGEFGLGCEYSCAWYEEYGTCEQTDGDLVVGLASCMDDRACEESEGIVGDKSCQGSWSCKYAFLNVGDESCKGANSCAVSGRSCVVKDKACLGENTCYGCDSVIEDFACIGSGACYRTGETSIAAEACHGERACLKLKDSQVGFEACRGEDACSETEKSIIKEYSCYTEDACSNSTDLTVMETSCVGYKSCSDAVGTTIGANSCKTSIAACYGLQNITIGSTSCNGRKACADGDKAANSTIGGLRFNVGDFACNCDGCCSCPDPMGTKSDVPDGQCNTPEQCCTGKPVKPVPFNAFTLSPTAKPTMAPTKAPTQSPTMSNFCSANDDNACGFTLDAQGNAAVSAVSVCIEKTGGGKKKKKKKTTTSSALTYENQCVELSDLVGIEVGDAFAGGKLMSCECCDQPGSTGCAADQINCDTEVCNGDEDDEGDEALFSICVADKKGKTKTLCEAPTFVKSKKYKTFKNCGSCAEDLSSS